jgi:Flp pilus assembly protein TadD
MLTRVLLFAALAAPVFAQDTQAARNAEVTKYLEELRARYKEPAFDEAEAKKQLANYTERLATATDPTRKAHLYVQIATVQRSLHDLNAAVTAARSAHELAPEDSTVTTDLVYLLAENKDYAEASVILGADATNGEALAERAQQLVDDRENDLAVACLQLAQKALPDDAGVDDRLGVVYLRANKTDQAIAALNRAESKAPKDALIHLHLAFAFAQKKYSEYARTELDTAIECHPSDEVREGIDQLRALLEQPKLGPPK